MLRMRVDINMLTIATARLNARVLGDRTFPPPHSARVKRAAVTDLNVVELHGIDTISRFPYLP